MERSVVSAAMADDSAPPSDTLGPNAWLVDEMYDSYAEDPSSVSDSWRDFFAGYQPTGPAGSESPAASTPDGPAPDGTAAAPTQGPEGAGQTSEAADPTVNLMPALLDSVRAMATEGEIIDALADVFGRYTERPVL